MVTISVNLQPGFRERLSDIAECLVKLRIEVASKRAAIVGGRAGMARDPDDRLIAFGNDGR